MNRSPVSPLPLSSALAVILLAFGLVFVSSFGLVSKAQAATSGDVLAANLADHDDSSDYTWDESSEVAVNLDDDSTTVSGSGASFDSATSTLTITAAGNYRLSGNLAGQVVVNAKNALVRVILDGATIESSSTSAIAVTKAEKAVVVLADGSTNSLSDGSTYALPDDDPNAALFSKANMTIAGEGSLTVNGRYNDGITSKDGLIIHSGTVNVTAVDDGIRGKDYLVVDDGDITVDATGGDALKSDDDEDTTAGYVAVNGGELDLTAGDDGIDAYTDAVVTGGETTISAVGDGVHSEENTVVDDGSVTVTGSEEGLEGGWVSINGGAIDVTSTDDGVNAANDTLSGLYIRITGGEIAVQAQGDGLDSNGTLTISGGTTVVSGPTGSDNSSLDSDGTMTITGGTVLAVGSAGMVQAPSSSGSQGWLAARLSSAQAAGTIVHVTDASDGILASYASTKAFQSVIFSSPDVDSGSSYRIYSGGTATCPVVGGLTESGSISGATLLTTVTAGTSTGGGMGGGMGSGLSSTTVASQAQACGTTTDPGDDDSDDGSSDDSGSDDGSTDDSSATRVTPRVRLNLAKRTVNRKARAKVTVRVTLPGRSGTAAWGKIVIRDGSRKIAIRKLTTARNGRLTFRLPRLAAGRHRILATAVSNSQHKAGSSARRTLIVRSGS